MPRSLSLSNPLLLGFEELETLLNALSQNADGYPPYNIEHIDERHLNIELAVAGFDISNLEVSVENNQLVIKGRSTSESDKAFLHKGIANRQFIKKFILADNMDVSSAHLHNGLLSVKLSRPEPDLNVKIIKIIEGKSNLQP